MTADYIAYKIGTHHKWFGYACESPGLFQTCLELKIVKMQLNQGPWQAEMSAIWWYQLMRHPKFHPKVFSGTNYVSESCLLGRGTPFHCFAGPKRAATILSA